MTMMMMITVATILLVTFGKGFTDKGVKSSKQGDKRQFCINAPPFPMINQRWSRVVYQQLPAVRNQRLKPDRREAMPWRTPTCRSMYTSMLGRTFWFTSGHSSVCVSVYTSQCMGEAAQVLESYITPMKDAPHTLSSHHQMHQMHLRETKVIIDQGLEKGEEK